MIFDRIMLPAQGRNEDYKFAQTGTVTLAASVGGAGGAEPTPSWLESAIKLDPESGFLSVDDWHVKGDLIIEGQVNQWFAQQLVVDDARIQVNRKQDGATVDSGLVIFDKDTSTEVSSLVFDVNGIWKAGGEAIATKPWVENSATAYNAARLGGYSAASYPRKAENAVITGEWRFSGGEHAELTINHSIDATAKDRSTSLILGRNASYQIWRMSSQSTQVWGNSPDLHFENKATEAGAWAKRVTILFNGNVGINNAAPQERLHVEGNGLFTGNLSAPTFVSGFAGSGWRLEAGTENHLTLDRLTVRGRMDIYELVVNQIRGTNGALWVSDSAKVASVSGNRLTIDTGGDTSFVPFVVNDLLRCQRWNGKNVKYYVVRVTAVGSNYIDVTLVDGSSPREAGDHLVRMGNTEDTDRQGALYLTSSDNNAPYMDVLDGVNSASFAGKTKVRIGRLDGITDPDLGTLSGYGLYTENGYFKGKVQVTGGNAATQQNIDDSINDLEIGGRNLLIKSTMSKGFYNADGIYVQNQTTFISDYIQVIPGAKYVVKTYINTGRVVYFDSDKNYISRGSLLATEVFQIPLGVAYIRYQSDRDDGLYNNDAKLEKGTKATDWTPAPEDVPSALDYLATAIQDGSTEIEGGLINTNVLMVKDTNGAVRGGISGLASDNIGFWTGGTYQAAINNNANVIFRKDGSFSLAGGKISGDAEGALSVDGGIVTGVIQSENWDGTQGSKFNLLDGSLEFGNTIKVDSFAKEIIVTDRDTQNTGVRIGDFLLSPTTGGAGALDVDLSGSRTVLARSPLSQPDPLYSLREDLTYINSSGVLGGSSVTVSTSLTAGNNYAFQTNIKARITRGDVLDTATDPIGAPVTVINSFSPGGVSPRIRVTLFSGDIEVGQQSFAIRTVSDIGVSTYYDLPLNVNIPFVAASTNLRVEITQYGEVKWKVRYPASQGSLVEYRNAGLIYSEVDASSRVRIIPSAAITELSAKGFLSLWGPSKYFRIYDRAGISNFIEARGAQEFISPNGTYRLRVTDSGIQKSTNGGISWTSL